MAVCVACHCAVVSVDYLPLLDAIVRIRAELLLSKQCCRDFQVAAEMLQNFKSDIVYQSEFSDEISLFD